MSERTIDFQLLNASEYDVRVTEERRNSKNKSYSRTSRKCVVVLNGKTRQGQSVVLACEGFRPSLRTLQSDFNIVDDLARTKGSNDVVVKPERAYEFRGYHPDTFAFDRWSFASNMAFLSARKALRNEGVQVYDAALPASMQMLAVLGISPCGWVSVRERGVDSGSAGNLRVERCHWSELSAAEAGSDTAPFRIMAFDIECASSHGEFPCAVKRYERVARELASRKDDQLRCESVETTLWDAFENDAAPIGPLSTKDSVRPSRCEVRDAAKKVAAAIAAYTRRGTKARDLFSSNKPPDADVTGKAPAKKAHAKYDLILEALQSSNLPPLAGDPIIQIGAVTATVSGDDRHQHIFVLGECEPSEDVNVHSFDSERQLLMAFLEHLRTMSPDFFTGYNTHGFDTAYIESRARELGVPLDALVGGEHDPSLYDARALEDVLEAGARVDMQARLLHKSGSDDRIEVCFEMPGRVSFDLMHVVQKGHNLPSYKLDAVAQHFTGEKKDDVSPAQIFASHHGTAAQRALVAKYCVQDCALVLHLITKLNTIMNALGMADVCSVPVAWIFSRGQGCKTLSLVTRQCWHDGFAVPAMSRSDTRVDYEGATVLQPRVGAYIDDPIAVLDFASLYPSSMISSNISHDTYVSDTSSLANRDIQLDDDLTFDLTLDRVDDQGNRLERERSGQTRARFVASSLRRGVLPRILERLLKERKRVRQQIKGEPDAFRRSTLDGLQLAYKITANSLYGQLGAPTSPVFLPDLAAATTAVGRRMLNWLKTFAETERGADVIYGDTDSCFIKFPPRGADITERIASAVEDGKACSDAFGKLIPAPHNAEFEKVLCPFLLLSKKRYTGGLYEDIGSEPRQVSMGIVLKRRDNAPIVKTIYGGVIERIMQRDVASAASFVREQVMRLAKGDVALDQLVISKTLRAPTAYVDPDKIAHVVLARRMNEREAGSAPAVGERIPFVFVTAPPGTLQGERIEHPDYLATRKRKVDYNHYLTNQVRKPLSQLLGVLVDQLPGSRVKSVSETPKKVQAEVDRLFFDRPLATAPATQQGLQDIKTFFKPSGRQ